jgi:hypothetical protein
MPAKQAEGQRIELDGGYVVMRPMNIDDLLAFAEADTNVGPAIRSVKNGCVESNFKNGKPLGEQSIDVLTAILRGWNRAEDEVALPPANGQLSVLPSTGK